MLIHHGFEEDSETRNKRVDFLGVEVDAIATEDLYRRLMGYVRDGNHHQVMYVNAHCMRLAWRDSEYRRILREADLVYADGVGVVWGARLAGVALPARVTATASLVDFCRRFASQRVSLFLLGSEPGVAEAAAQILTEEIPGLEVKGTHHGFFSPEQGENVADLIARSRADIVLVGLGVPYQEKWVAANFRRMDSPVVWCVGGVFAYLSTGGWRRPALLVDLGLEWVFRLFSDPRNLWRRYLVGNIAFLLNIWEGLSVRDRTGQG
jgi:N-acetylglucosaminyldiphosphoundecaprenol N-acetyl-beta-D-mannosaminyltransferase